MTDVRRRWRRRYCRVKLRPISTTLLVFDFFSSFLVHPMIGVKNVDGRLLKGAGRDTFARSGGGRGVMLRWVMKEMEKLDGCCAHTALIRWV